MTSVPGYLISFNVKYACVNPHVSKIAGVSVWEVLPVCNPTITHLGFSNPDETDRGHSKEVVPVGMLKLLLVLALK